MPRGDLTSAPPLALLGSLGERAADGCLRLWTTGSTGAVYLKHGLIYAAMTSAESPDLGARLTSAGALSAAALAEALEVQETELFDWRLGELLVCLGYVDADLVQSFAEEQLVDSLWQVLGWREGRWGFRPRERTREELARPRPLGELLVTLAGRAERWEQIRRILPGPDVAPELVSAPGEAAADVQSRSLLRRVDGVRTVRALAAECGYTLFEAADVVSDLVDRGVLQVSSGPATGQWPPTPRLAEGPTDPRQVDVAVQPLRSAPADLCRVAVNHVDPEPAAVVPEAVVSEESLLTASATALAAPAQAVVGEATRAGASVRAAEVMSDLTAFAAAAVAAGGVDVPPPPDGPADVEGGADGWLTAGASAGPGDSSEAPDTAALMRELTSLVLDDPPTERPRPVAPPPRHPSRSRPDPRARRKGLFGR